MLTIGVDLSEVERIEKLLAQYGDRFARRIFTEQELAYCNGRSTSLAGRFAVKEAVAKALGTGIGKSVAWLDIEIVNDARGKPGLVLHNRAKARAAELGLHHWAISLSHTQALAIGFVVATGDGKESSVTRTNYGNLDSK